MVDEYRREIIGTAGSLLGIGWLSRQSDDIAGPIIVNGEEGPALEVKDAYLLDDGEETATFTQYAKEPYEVEGLVENVGDETGTRTFDLLVDDSVEDERAVELEPAGSETIFFNPDAPSVDQETTLTIMLGDTPVGELVVEPRVDISVTGAFLLDADGERVDARTLTEGETLESEADLENDGIDSGEIDLALELEGTELDSATTTVDPDAGVVEQALSGEVPSVDEETEYAAKINDASAGTVTVEPAPAIPDSVVTQYEFEDASDTSVAVDAVGSNDADITGASYSSDSKCGSLALQTDGTDDIIISQQSVDLVADGDAEAAAVGGFMKKDSESLTDNIAWAADSDNRLSASTNETNYRGILLVNGSFESVDSGVAIDTSNYVHVVVSVDQNDLWIIIDGTEEARTSHSLDITNIGSGDLHTGARIDNEFEYDGLTDNATFANDALSESDTQQLIDQC